MKNFKSLKTLAVLALSVTGASVLASCGGSSSSSSTTPSSSSESSSSSTSSSETPKTAVQKAIADAETLSQDELFKKAAEELGTNGKLKILATTSRGGKDAVKNLFIQKLQAYNSAITDPLKYDTTVDGTIYTTLKAEVNSKVTDGYSATITQDGYQLATTGMNKIKFENYTPKDWKESAGVEIDAADPMTLQYNFKTIMYNNKGLADFKIDNIWDLTDSSMKGKIDTMDPNNENVNMDWLIQLTSADQIKILKDAYNASTRDSDVNLENYVKYIDSGDADQKYAYAFIGRFLENAVFYADDGAAMTHLAATPGNAGWIVYSKILKVSETADISKKNIVVAALGENNTDGATMGDSQVDGFAGFMYKHYLQIMPNAQYPYAACAFFDLISTNKDAYKVWGADVGDYPTLPSINQDRTKGGVDYKTEAYGTTNVACLNDPTSDWWLNTGKAVVEDPTYIGSAYDSVIDFIDYCISAK